MRIAIGSDDAGFPLKGAVFAALEADGHGVLDLGAFGPEPADYHDKKIEILFFINDPFSR